VSCFVVPEIDQLSLIVGYQLINKCLRSLEIHCNDTKKGGGEEGRKKGRRKEKERKKLAVKIIGDVYIKDF